MANTATMPNVVSTVTTPHNPSSHSAHRFVQRGVRTSNTVSGCVVGRVGRGGCGDPGEGAVIGLLRLKDCLDGHAHCGAAARKKRARGARLQAPLHPFIDP